MSWANASASVAKNLLTGCCEAQRENCAKAASGGRHSAGPRTRPKPSRRHSNRENSRHHFGVGGIDQRDVRPPTSMADTGFKWQVGGQRGLARAPRKSRSSKCVERQSARSMRVLTASLDPPPNPARCSGSWRYEDRHCGKPPVERPNSLIRPDGGVVTQRTANPCTPVRFRLGPPLPRLAPAPGWR
jgi:hypothetical protein